MSDTQNQWIPVSERLPEDVSKPYLVLTTEGKTPAVAHRGKGGSWFAAFGSGSWIPNVTHWMDPPEPPQPPKPSDPFEAWYAALPNKDLYEQTPRVIAQAAWNAAKAHYAKPLPDLETWAREHANGALISLHHEGPYVSYRIAKIIWNAAQGKPEA